jgi:hypothetical protein
LYAGALAPGAAMLEANALAQAFAEALSGEALETAGDRAATVTAARATFRRIMVVFLDGQKYQRPGLHDTEWCSSGQMINFCTSRDFPHA